MGNESSVPGYVESAKTVASKVHKGDNERGAPSETLSASNLSSAVDVDWSQLFKAMPIEILTSIFRYLQLNFKNVIGLHLVSKKWSKYIFSRIPLDLDASFISFKRLSFLPLISGLKVAGSCLTSDVLKEINKINNLQKLYIGYDRDGSVRPKDYALLNKLKNLRELALDNLRSLPPELDLGHLTNLNSLEVSGIQASLKIKGLPKLANLKKLILMRQTDPTLVPLSDIARLTNLQYLHMFGITQQSDVELEQLALPEMKNLKTLKIVTNSTGIGITLPRNFSSFITHIESLTLMSLKIPNILQMDPLVNLKQLELYEVEVVQGLLPKLPNLEILKVTFEDRRRDYAELNFDPGSAAKNEKLRELTLSHCSFNDENCLAITKFPNLEYLAITCSMGLNEQHVYSFAEMAKLKVLDLSQDVHWMYSYVSYNVPFYQQIEARAKTLRTVYLIGYRDFRNGVAYSVDFVFSRK